MSDRDDFFLPFRKLRLLFFLMTGFIPCFAQNNPVITNPLFEERAESAGGGDESTDNNAFVTELAFFLKHPINLNTTKKEELQLLYLLTDIQIDLLLTHIEKNGSLILIYELQAIEGFDLQTIQQLLPYVYVGDQVSRSSLSKKELWKNGEHTFRLRYAQILEKQAGFRPVDSMQIYKNPNSRYLGSPQKVLASYRYAYGKRIRFGMTAEKDQGELFFKQNPQFNKNWYAPALQGKLHSGFDFYSMHLFLQEVKMIHALVLGDYNISFGQGLTAWSGFSFGKSSDMLVAKKTAAGIRPFTTADENRFMRGAATTIRLNKTAFTIFYSRKKVDASLADTLGNGNLSSIASILQTGIHSTPQELNNKHTATQITYGGNVTYNKKRCNVGITFMHDQLNLPDRMHSSSYYKLKKGNPQYPVHIGLDYQFIIRNALFFGETSGDRNAAIATVNGLFISLDPRLSFTVVHRYYAKTYENKFSNAFGEAASSNEKGLYMGISVNPCPFLKVNACYDRFEFPWLRYQVDAPSKGNDLEVQLLYSPSKKLNYAFRVRQNKKEKNASVKSPLSLLGSMQSENYRFTITHTLSQAIKVRNRVEWIHVKSPTEIQEGYIIYQDVVYKHPRNSFSATVRYALFQTDGYDSRLYEYENDVLGSNSIPSFYDRGSRFYILFNYSLTKHIELWLRYAQTFYDNKDVISEGTLMEIQGNTKSEIKAQLQVKW